MKQCAAKVFRGRLRYCRSSRVDGIGQLDTQQLVPSPVQKCRQSSPITLTACVPLTSSRQSTNSKGMDYMMASKPTWHQMSHVEDILPGSGCDHSESLATSVCTHSASKGLQIRHLRILLLRSARCYDRQHIGPFISGALSFLDMQHQKLREVRVGSRHIQRGYVAPAPEGYL